jgi:hypothetical protein
VLRDINDFHATPLGYGTFAVVEFLLFYVIVSRAIDTGSLWQYALAIVLFVGVISNIVRLFHRHTKLVHKPHVRSKKHHKKA